MGYKPEATLSVQEVDDRTSSTGTTIQIRDLTVAVDCTTRPSVLQKLTTALSNKSPAKESPTKTILDNVSATIKGGSLTAVVGASGCGKTTLLSVISQRAIGRGLHVSGSVAYGGVALDLDTRSKPRPDIAYALQEDVLLPQLTVRETLTYAAELRLPASISPEERARHVTQVIIDLGLSTCADTRIGDSFHKGCSGGEKRRTIVAIQMLTDSPVLFLDEPTTGLDSTSAFQNIKILSELARKGKTIVMTSKHGDLLGTSDTDCISTSAAVRDLASHRQHHRTVERRDYVLWSERRLSCSLCLEWLPVAAVRQSFRVCARLDNKQLPNGVREVTHDSTLIGAEYGLADGHSREEPNKCFCHWKSAEYACRGPDLRDTPHRNIDTPQLEGRLPRSIRGCR
jgi:ABC-type multidrug transport system ATPase subunit